MTSRHRERTSDTETEKLSWSSNGYLYFPDLTVKSYTTSAQDEVMDDTVIPHFRKRSKSGEIFNNPCEYSSVRTLAENDERSEALFYVVSKTDASIHRTKTGGNITGAFLENFAGPGVYWYNYPAVSDVTFDTVSDAKQIALGKIDPTPYEFFEDLLEVRETLDFIRNPLKALRDLARAFSRKRQHILRDTPILERADALSNLWKQYRFAAMPLVRSIMNAKDAMADKFEAPSSDRFTAHGRSSSSNTASDSPYYNWGSGVHPWYARTRTKEKESHAAILYRVSNPIRDDWRFRLGLRSKDVPKTLWEIVPLSFMIDRAFDIKNMIDGLVNLADPSVTILAANVTTKTNILSKIQAGGCWDSYNRWTATLSYRDHIRRDDFHYSRVLWSPSALDTIPVFNWRGLIGDITSITDLVTVTYGLFRG